MKVLFISITPVYDIEERGIYTDLLRCFIKDGHSLTVVSPKMAKFTTPKHYENVTFDYVNVGSLTKVHPIKKIINYFFFTQKLRKTVRQSSVQYDLVLYSTPPIQLTSVLKVLRQQQSKAVFYLMLKDIFPQNAVDLNMIPTKGLMSFLYRYYNKMELRLYQLSDYIGVMSPANKTYLLNRYQNLSSKVELLPNAIDLTSSPIITSDKITVRNQYGLPVDKVISVFGGNIGKPQGIDFILDVIKDHEEVDNSFLLFVGNGTEYDKLSSFIFSNNIKKAQCFPQLSKKEFDELLYHCDIGLLFLDYRFTFPNFPSRILSYFEFSKPVLAATDDATDIKDVLQQYQTGKWVMSRSPETFITDLKSLVEDESLRNQLGKNARHYLEQYWTVDKAYLTILSHL